jgi:hypothetical protein
MDEQTYRVAFERDEGQQYSVGARVTVHAMNGLFRTVTPSPADGDYRVLRCERIRDVGWQALRVSLFRATPSEAEATSLTMVAADG